MARKLKNEKRSVNKGSSTMNERVSTVVMLVVTYALLLVLCITMTSPERYDLKVGDVAKKTITASKDVLDEVTTQRKREAAASAVAPVYYKDESVSQVVLSDLKEAFDELRAVQALGAEMLAAREEGETVIFTEDEYKQAAALVTKVSFSNYQLATLLKSNVDDIDDLYESLQSATRTTLVGTVPEGQESDALNNIQQLVAFNTRSDLWWNVAMPTLRACIQPNMKIDQEATESNRQKAMDEVEPVYYKQGQNIVLKGDRVTESQMAVLTALGLLQGDRLDMELYIGTSVVLVLILLMYVCLCLLICREKMRVRLNQTIVLLVGLLNIALCVLLSQLNMNLMPIALGSLILTVAVGSRPALVYNILLALVLSLLTIKGNGLVPTQVLSIVLMTIASGTVGVYSLKKKMTRGAMLCAGLYVGLLNGVVVLCVSWLTSNDLTSNINDALYGLGGGVISGILCVGIMPVLESLFNLCTPTKLLELANPNHPILRRLMIEASGTYHHSVIVANIAEAAAEAIGANPLLVRVGAYYHDIGKLKRPIYFKENQMGENPHDFTDPRVSNAIITEHPKDGVALAQKHHLPQPIIDLIRQHHGDTPTMFFYHKAIQMYGAENVDVADFRYPGPKPQTREAAILMLADTVEAAVRAMPEPTPEKIMQLIRKLVRGKIDDGQMDESPLTFRDIDRICTAFATVLNGVFHERIEYPSIDVPQKQAESADTAAKAQEATAQLQLAEKPAEQPAEEAAPPEESQPEEATEAAAAPEPEKENTQA